ncbi:hypothetical protein [Methylomonas sp. UP202]|uniref:hypothetical protein n=1 Tax=Methylomonas sp. UP202 TaxID=3040943 RepID=UPI00247B1874|nr:hypothetical protein [Methylomonas sp. UP202]WGS87504.1 hypothetical protein QC632_07035 [Methylomonas sp. UP202]
MARIRQVSQPDRVRSVNAFLSTSLNDYLAARALFLAELPQQAAILSSTAIEKACKAVLAFHGNESRGHLKKAHWNAVRAFDPNLFRRFDPEFFALNQKAYLLRYTDDLPPGFNLVIASREYLAALDETLMHFHQSFTTNSGGAYKNNLDRLVQQGDSRAVAQNHIVTGEDKHEFTYSVPQYVYEARYQPSHGLLEVEYWSAGPPRKTGFLREGCRVTNVEKSIFEFSHFP